MTSFLPRTRSNQLSYGGVKSSSAEFIELRNIGATRLDMRFFALEGISRLPSMLVCLTQTLVDREGFEPPKAYAI